MARLDEEFERRWHQEAEAVVGLLLCLELAAVLNAVVARELVELLFHGFQLPLDVLHDTGQVAALDVAEHDDPPLHVFSVQRIRAGGVQHLGHLAQSDLAARGRVEDGLVDLRREIGRAHV